MVQGLAEADAGVEDDTSGINPGEFQGLHSLLEVGTHLCDHIDVMRVELHGARLPFHAHQHNAR